ncbi:uncharacterized protein LOC129711694 isoform X3 [Leucoraja erinacea]|uniref:uncharacterized protein LOC129711694 isoform X3 n=1 Tax=Leucoraja erinaceus TaxID=7782 RepID=UPI002455CF2C|nr:uncharacterized protein LOC129711694 isoform X3 [Leucoraja erinacea]
MCTGGLPGVQVNLPVDLQVYRLTSSSDPYQNECNYRKIFCHEKANCRLDEVTQLFYCQCLPGYTGDGINNCQEPLGLISVSDLKSCSSTELQTCLITKPVGGNVTFSVSASGYELEHIAWFKFYASQGPIFHSYRRRLTPPAELLPGMLLKNHNLALELVNISEDDFYPNKFWVEFEAEISKRVDSSIEAYDDLPFELLNPSRIRYYFILDSPSIDIGQYLTGDMVRMHISPYFAISDTAFVRWSQESSKLSQFKANVSVLAEGAEGITINGIRDDEFGNVRTVVYDFTEQVPGKVMIAQRLFNIRKDITKTCVGSIRSIHSCKCNKGFEGNGVHCMDINECSGNLSSNCLPGATCINIYGSYKCQCEKGFDGDGITSCIDKDECVTEQTACSPSAFCINTLGSFQCVCQSGHIGDGVHCVATSIWTPWSPWSVCTASCGLQNKMRIRMCTHPESGMRCEGPSAELVECGMLRPCPVNGKWSDWSPWSPCTSSCSGIKKRVRVCDNPTPSSGGLLCTGSFEQAMPCESPDCPVTGFWSLWTPWSPCPVSCGIAFMKRSRFCNAVFSKKATTYCQGHNQEERSCGFPVDYCKYLTQPTDSVLTGKWT